MTIDELIIELGIDKMAPEDQQDLLTKIYQALQMRVGNRLAESLSEEQLEQFVKLAEQKDDEAAIKELNRLVPDYEELVKEEIANLKEDMQALVPPKK